MKYKKQRGQKRKIRSLLNYIDQMQPFNNIADKYERFLVPCGRFISSPKTSGKIKTAFCKAWIDKTAKIINEKPNHLPFCKVIAVINENDLWYSKIIVFYDESYYASFFQRNSPEQTWKPIPRKSNSLLQRRNIKSCLEEKGYYETIIDKDLIHKSKLWFYGEVL